MLFTFPSRYWCTIGHRGVLRLGGWSPHLQTGFHVSRPTQGQNDPLPVRGCHPLWRAFPDASGSDRPATGLIPFRSPLLGESLLMSFPPATEMFQFAGFASILCRTDTARAVGCPIRKSSDHRVLPPPRSLSQGATSFIASRCQGIHQMPFFFARELSIPMRRHTDQRTEVRCQMTAPASGLSRVFRNGNPLIRTHTVGDRCQKSDVRCQSRCSGTPTPDVTHPSQTH